MASRNDDLRLASILTEGSSPRNTGQNPDANIGLLGYPSDAGVVRNGGRAGSALGPGSLRTHLGKVGPLVNPEFSIDVSRMVLHDFGDVSYNSELEEMHKSLTADVESILRNNFLPVVIGGGNDQSYCNAKALMNYLGHGNINVINIDAHLDVRPLIGDDNLAHSGSPFRQLLTDPVFQGRFTEFAAQGNQCSYSHSKFVEEKGGSIVWLSQVKQEGALRVFNEIIDSRSDTEPVFLSFDIDSITSADCPGVSCPAAIGLSAQDALDICFSAGCRRNVKLVDFSEYNPKVESYRTGRLLATMIYYFLMGRSRLVLS